MEINLKIHYITKPGEQICICGEGKLLGNWDTSKAINLNYLHDGIWSISLKIPKNIKSLEYKYLLINEGGGITWEWGSARKLKISDLASPLLCAIENWRSPANEEKVMYSSAFSKAIMKPERTAKGGNSKAKKTLHFRMPVPRIGKGQQLCVSGNQNELGNWEKSAPLLLSCGDEFPIWSGSINASGLSLPIVYKYGIYDIKKKEIVEFETGQDRIINELPEGNDEFVLMLSDESFGHSEGKWKGAGVAVPVFSLRSDKGFGVGEFNDLLDFIDWAKMVGLKMVQILPVNETIATQSWLDSYPYKSISVIALHPIYLNIKKMGALKDKKLMAEFAAKQKDFNSTEFVNYLEVHRTKSRYYKLLFDQEKDSFFEKPEYKKFYEKNKDWLLPYAAFAYLRDKMKTADFRLWGKFSKYNKKTIEKLSQPGTKEWDDISVHYFLQFHLDKQLREVSDYARANGIVLKGDIPIGISPNSMEAWTEPHLFNLDAQAGAPPDDFAVKGQNWGFPTYNWERMAEDNYAWWRNRLQKMAEYFDAYRIDHILGFFRIWQIPIDAVEGILGAFNPALPLTVGEIESWGIRFDYDRLVKPYIRYHLLHPIFGEFTDEVIATFLNDTGYGTHRMKEEFDTQKKVNQYFLKNVEEEDLTDKNRKIRDGLFDLLSNVLFIQTAYDQYHPRITLQFTSSFAELDDYTKDRINQLYIHFFYKRHEEFWYHKGMEKLPAITAASDMLICGEDLGMVPDCVHPVMDKLSILRLDIQRMSKDPKIKFAHPANAPYMSVCTTSTHDMATIRGWWEEDRESIQQFFNNELGNEGIAPPFAEPWICQQIINQHVYSPAMWTTFPVQDLIAMDGELRWEKTHMEKINEPSNVRHRWKYRMHQSIETLKKADKLNELIKSLVEKSGRNS
jgi:4-alpha-glucanotransferase